MFNKKDLPITSGGGVWYVHYIVAGVPVASGDILQLENPFARTVDLVPISFDYRPSMVASVFVVAAFLKHHKYKAL